MNRKELTRAYKETAKPLGIFQVRNTINGRVLIGSSVDVPSRLNRERAQLALGTHSNKELQSEWRTFGAEAFDFTTLDTLEPRDDPDDDPRADLAALEHMWIDKLEPFGERGYHTAARRAG